jgi:hypothetical protein
MEISAPFDVVEIMRRIREENRRRRDLGSYTDEELEELARGRFRAAADRAYIDPRLLERFLDPGHDWNIATDYIIRTHRTDLAARLALVAKRIVRPVVRLYTDHVLDRQTQINQYLFHLLTNAVREVVRLEMKQAALERRCEALERAARGKDPA